MNFEIPFSILRPGDSVCLVSPSYSAKKDDIFSGIKVLESYGLRIELGPNVFKSWGNFAGTDRERISDLQWALDHPKAKAIHFIRGGYGLGRILHLLNWEIFFQNPKWLIGLSDITLMHLQAQKFNFPSLHGPMIAKLGQRENEESSYFLMDFLLGKKQNLFYQIFPESLPKETRILEGILWGGNLSMLAHAIGRGLESQAQPYILFLEEVGEAFYRIDRMIWQLKMAVQNFLPMAIVLGQFTDCPSLAFPRTLGELVADAFEGIPVFSGLKSGHGNPNFPLIHGLEARIKNEKGTYFFSQSSIKPE